jgi:hypothetical protein
MQIKCKTDGCPGNVEYTPQIIQLLKMFVDALKKTNVKSAAQMDNEEFSGVVNTIVDDEKNKFNTTKTAYLTCDFTGQGGPHTNAYQVPAK